MHLNSKRSERDLRCEGERERGGMEGGEEGREGGREVRRGGKEGGREGGREYVWPSSGNEHNFIINYGRKDT